MKRRPFTSPILALLADVEVPYNYRLHPLHPSPIVEEWDVWPQGPRLQGEDGGKAGARGSNKTTE